MSVLGLDCDGDDTTDELKRVCDIHGCGRECEGRRVACSALARCGGSLSECDRVCCASPLPPSAPHHSVVLLVCWIVLDRR